MIRRTISKRHIVGTCFPSQSNSNSLPSAGRLAIKHHPDKNPDDPHGEERFKDIAIAYQTLSDDNLRRKYNEFGPKECAPEGGYIDQRKCLWRSSEENALYRLSGQ